ncbi:MAG TPA: class I SAM-dependent methyltransferase [Candidatus Paceibacterota bacterium]|nr:class I SAM-dependent methyltransferase [Candidatus Paceibacterota bacterium]
MSRKYLNDKWCVRCGRKEPTPYLKKNLNKINLWENTKVLDIGCGNGRNSTFMKKEGCYVISLDMCEDFGKKFILGHDSFPRGKYDVFLANYVFMFLDEKERFQVYDQIHKHSHTGSILMVEMYAAKDAYEYDLEDITNYFSIMGWTVINKVKDKFIMGRDRLDEKAFKILEKVCRELEVCGNGIIIHGIRNVAHTLINLVSLYYMYISDSKKREEKVYEATCILRSYGIHKDLKATEKTSTNFRKKIYKECKLKCDKMFKSS